MMMGKERISIGKPDINILNALVYVILVILMMAAHLTAKAESLTNSQTNTTDEQSTLFEDIPSVFTASRHEQPVTKAPASVDIITADQIKRYGWRTVSSMLASLPGFLTINDGIYDHVGVRGLNLPGDYNTRILVLIDGHRVNENLQDYAGLGNDFVVDVQNIERVEVVRGPASALYGSSAFLAVVNVITQRGRDLKGTKLTADMGGFDTYGGQISNGQKYENGLETLFTASYSNSNGRNNIAFPGLGTAQNLDGEQVKRVFGKLGWGDFTLSGGFMDRIKASPIGTSNFFGLEGSFYHDRRAYSDLNYHHHFSHDWDLTSRLYWDSYQFDDNLPSSTLASPNLVNQDQWLGQWFGNETLLSHTFFDTHRATLGFEYRRNYQQMMNNMDINPYSVWANNQLTSNIYSFFLQDEWTIRNNLHFHAGGRYDHYDSFGGTFNPRSGLIYEPMPGTNLKLLYGTAFRAPNAFESFYTCCLGTWISNSNLKPEKIETYEIVLEQRLGDNYDLRINPYYNNILNLISQVAVGSITEFKNYANANTHGVETQIKAHFDDIEGRLSYTFQQTNIAGGNILPNSPSHMVKLNLTAPFIAEKLFGGIEVQYVSRGLTVSGRATTDGYTITNFNMFTRHWLPGVELTGGVYNLFNAQYTSPLSSEYQPETITQYGRNFRVRISYEF